MPQCDSAIEFNHEIDWDTLLNLIQPRLDKLCELKIGGDCRKEVLVMFNMLNDIFLRLERLYSTGHLSGETLQKEYNALEESGIFSEIDKL